MARSKEFNPEEKLLKARTLFWEKGYQGTSIEDLVQGMRLNRGSIYDTYGDKHSLFLQCLKSYVEEAEEAYLAIAAKASSPMKGLEQIVQTAAATTLQEEKSCMAVKASFELGSADAQVHEVLRSNADAITGIFKTLLVKARDAGELDKNKDPLLLARFIQCTLTGFWQHYALYQNPVLVRKLIGQLFDLIKS